MADRKKNYIFQLFSSESFSFISMKHKKGGREESDVPILISRSNHCRESAAAQKPGGYKRKVKKERLLESVQVPISQL